MQRATYGINSAQTDTGSSPSDPLLVAVESTRWGILASIVGLPMGSSMQAPHW